MITIVLDDHTEESVSYAIKQLKSKFGRSKFGSIFQSITADNDSLKPVIVNVTVENTTNEPINFSSQAFSLYDKNDINTDFDSTTYSNNIPNYIAANKKSIVDIVYASKDSGPFSVSLGDVLWEEK